MQPPTAQTYAIGDGDRGTAQTVAQMCRLIDEGSKDPRVNRTAIQILKSAGIAPFDFRGETRAIFNWQARHIRFLRNIAGKQVLRSAIETIDVGAGSCADQTILQGALLKTVGQAVRIVTIAANPEDPEEFTHVYAEAQDEQGNWIALDTARKGPVYARPPRRFYRKVAWECDTGEGTDVYLGFNPARLPRGGRPGATNPVIRAAYAAHSAGLGYYNAAIPRTPLQGPRRARKRYIGQDDGSFDWSSLTAAIPSITTGTANIITASRANPINLVPNTGASSSGTPAASVLNTETWAALLGSPTVLLLGGALVLVALMGGRDDR